MIEKKIQGYAQRMSELETALVDEGKEEESLKQQDEALVQQRSLLLQKQTVVEKRVYGSFLEEVGVASVQELESEYMAKLRENESMQTECRTHITLIESKREYNRSIKTSVNSVDHSDLLYVSADCHAASAGDRA